MQRSDAKRVLKKLDQIERSLGVMLKSKVRSLWRPGTHTGRDDLERSERHEMRCYALLAEIRELVAADHPDLIAPATGDD